MSIQVAGNYNDPRGPGFPGSDDSLRVPLFAGLLSAIGTLLVGLLCMLIWFAVAGDGRIRLGATGEPGEFDDESALLEEEQDALELMDEHNRDMYYEARAYQMAHPPNSCSTDISLSQFMSIQEKGVHAWEFESDYASTTCIVQARSELEFFDGVSSVQTNLPLPKQNEVYYWEVKIYEKPEDTKLGIGLSTKPYPLFRLPGYHKYSVAYDSEGKKRINQPFSAPQYGPPLQQGDVVGVGYKPRTGSIFFTRNGKKLEEALHGLRMNLFPTIGSTGPATLFVNFGQGGFVFIEANVKKWGLASAHGSLAPPPPYGAERDYVLLETGQNDVGESSGEASWSRRGSGSGRYMPSSTSDDVPPPSFIMATTPNGGTERTLRGRIERIDEVDESDIQRNDEQSQEEVHDQDRPDTHSLDTSSEEPSSENIGLERIRRRSSSSNNTARPQDIPTSNNNNNSTSNDSVSAQNAGSSSPIVGSPPPSYAVAANEPVQTTAAQNTASEHNEEA